jgi:hypothetical protein
MYRFPERAWGTHEGSSTGSVFDVVGVGEVDDDDTVVVGLAVVAGALLVDVTTTVVDVVDSNDLESFEEQPDATRTAPARPTAIDESLVMGAKYPLGARRIGGSGSRRIAEIGSD